MQEVCALEPHGAGLHTQEELTLTPEVDIKHIFAGRKAACWHRVEEQRHQRSGREEGEKGWFAHRPPAAPGTELTLKQRLRGCCVTSL